MWDIPSNDVSALTPYQAIANAVIIQASRDYAQAIVDGDLGGIKSNKRFFGSELYYIYTNIPANAITDKVEAGASDFIRRADYKAKHNVLSKYKKGTQILDENTAVFRCGVCGGKVFSLNKKLHRIYWKQPQGELDAQHGRYVAEEQFGYRTECKRCGLHKEYIKKIVHYKMGEWFIPRR